MTRVAGDWVEILISDTGPGIQDADTEKLFEPFFSTKSMGTGLGLPIARDILAAHGGSLEHCSGPGEGATFLLRLPLRDQGYILGHKRGDAHERTAVDTPGR